MNSYKMLGMMVVTVLLSSCVSMSDYSALKSEIERYKTDSAQRQSDLEKKVDTFINAYNPDMHRELDNNIIVASQYKDRMREIVSEMEMLSRQIHDLASASQNDSMIVAENMRTSIAQNVVNEFHQLKYNWDRIVADMHQSVSISQDAASKAQLSAIQAAEKSGAAQKAAEIAVATAQDAMKQQPGSGTDIQLRLARIEDDIKKLKAMLGTGKENTSLDMLYNQYKDLSKRVSDLEKIVRAQYADPPAKQ